ncbi:MAG: homocitrate synthase [Herpetosiphon sp.]
MGQDTVRIVDTTLREGEQFAPATWSSAQKISIAEALDAFGVDYLELTSPVASPQSELDLRTIAALPLRAGVLTHTRCTMADVQLAVDCGVRGVNLLYGSSALLRELSHGRTVDQILDEATQCIRFLQECGVEVRFSCEDAFRTDRQDLHRIYRAVDALGVNRVGIADTVGIATPFDVAHLVADVRSEVGCDIEFHGHNDGGCAIANAFCAWQAGATHIDTTVLGIGERNGITSLSGLIARLYLTDPVVTAHYQLEQLQGVDELVAGMLGMAIPFNSCITGGTAFTHKAGLHTNAVLRNPHSYESLDPAAFGRRREVMIGHRLTGSNAIRHRAEAIGVALDDTTVHAVTRYVKHVADERPLSDAELDNVIRRAVSLERGLVLEGYREHDHGATVLIERATEGSMSVTGHPPIS